MWRIFQLNKHLTRPNHPWSKFGSGNLDSLSKAAKEAQTGIKTSQNATSEGHALISQPTASQDSTTSEQDADGGAVGREIRRRLVEWWKKEYCASRMRLSIVGKGKRQITTVKQTLKLPLESLDDLSELAAKMFSPIPNRGRDPLPMIDEHPFGPEEKGVRTKTH